MKKRIASLFLAIAVIASLGIGAMAATTTSTTTANNSGINIQASGAAQFTVDLPTTHWAWTSIDRVVKAGLFNGTSATTFGPQESMTRAQFVVVLTRMENLTRAANNKLVLERVPTDTVFTDVPREMWCAGAVSWATQQGIVEGYSVRDDAGNEIRREFRPQQAITRAQMAAFVYRYLNNFKKYTTAKLPLVSPAPTQFTDYNMVPEVFRTAVDYCHNRGLINGFSDGTLRPNIALTRAQMCAIISRFLDVLKIETTSSGSSGRGGGGGGGGGGGYGYAVTIKITDTDVNDAANAQTGKGGSVTYGLNTITSATTATGYAVLNSYATPGMAFTFNVNPSTGYHLGGIQVKDANGGDVAVTSSGTACTFTMPYSNVAIDVSFSNASVYLSPASVGLGGLYDAKNGNLVTNFVQGRTYYVKLDQAAIYANGGSLKEFGVKVNGAENKAYLTEDTSFGLYNNAYHDGWYSFVWNGEDVEFTIDRTTYTYDLKVEMDLGPNVSSPSLYLDGRAGTETLSSLAPLLNEQVGNRNNALMVENTIKSIVELLDDDVKVNIQNRAMLERVMKDTIDSRVREQTATFRNSMMTQMANEAGGWKQAVEQTIWNSGTVQNNDFVKLLRENGYLPAVGEGGHAYPVYVDDAAASAVRVHVDDTAINAIVEEVVNMVTAKMDDMVIGATLKNAAGYAPAANTYNERYLQIVGSASMADGSTSLDLGSLDPSTQVTVSLEGSDPDVYISLNAAGAAAVSGSRLGITRLNGNTLATTVNGVPIPNGTQRTEGGTTLIFNSTLGMWTLDPGLTYANGSYTLTKLTLSELTRTVSVGQSANIGTIDLSSVEAPVPVANLGGPEMIEGRYNSAHNRLGDNAQASLEAIYAPDSTSGYTVISWVDSEGNDSGKRLDKVTIGGETVVEVLTASGETSDKASLIHVITDPAKWTGSSANYFDGYVARGDALRQAISDDSGNPAGTYYARLGRGTFSGGYGTAWASGFDKSAGSSTRWSFADAFAKDDSTAADLWRAYGLAETNAGTSMTMRVAPSFSTSGMIGSAMNDVLGASQISVVVTVTRSEAQ